VKLVRIAWKTLVGIKDALVLLAMLLFFGSLFVALNAKPTTRAVTEGALLVDLNGAIVEQPAAPQPFALDGGSQLRQIRLRDVLHVLDTAKSDAKVKAVVLDFSGFAGGYPGALSEVADAVGRVRAAGKPVLAYSLGYTDGDYRLAANASEVWEHPMGGTLFSGPGGNQLYYKGLIDKLGVNVHVYRVGKFKSFVEPYTRADQSPEAKEAVQALYSALSEDWHQQVKKARPKADVDAFLAKPGELVTAAQGDIAKANLQRGLVDKLGDRLAFDKHVADLVGSVSGKPVGTYKAIKFDDYLKANPLPTAGDAIGVLTVAGDIVDGKAGAGSAGGDTLSTALLKGLADKKLKALVVRVDSPGGSALASEVIRQAVLQAKSQGLPVVVSMGSVAASGGYWVSTAGDVVFAEPNTITGSIGIFGIIPTFENSLKKIGVTSDGMKTTPLSGQPDVLGGTTPEIDTILQSAIENGYRQFITRVAEARKMSPARVDEIAQGRVWDGGTARQLGLVDRFGSLKDAIAEAAKRAKLDPANVHAEYLEKKPGWFAELVSDIRRQNDDDDAAGDSDGDVFARIAGERRAMLVQAVGDMQRLARGGSVQARCLECGGFAPATVSANAADVSLIGLLRAHFGL